MEPTKELTDALFIEKVMRARRTPPERKFLAGARLYEYMRSIAMTAIRNENPNATPEEHRKLFQRRLQINRMMEDHR